MGLLGVSRLCRTWSLAAPPDAVWRVVADSARLNEVSGLPHYRLDETPNPDGSVTRIGSATLNGYALEWEEPAGEWVTGKWFRQERRLRRGPVRRFVTAYTIEPDGAGTRLVWRVEAEPAGWAGLALRASRFLERFADGTEARIRMLLADAPAEPPARDASRLPEGAAARAAAAVERLTSDGHRGADRLARYLLGAAETDLDRVRPLQLARTWQADRRRIIELCLAAVPAGLMVSRWDLLCPRCRGAKLTATSLADLPRTTHCGSCNIGYDRDFARNVELSFQPAPSIRPVRSGGFCLSGPITTSHVAVQLSVAPGERRGAASDLPPGPYRVRTIEPGGEIEFDLDGAMPEIVLDGQAVEWGAAGAPGDIAVVNRGSLPRTLVIERRDWVADALTAHHATTLQAFRDLFGTDSLKPGDDVAIDNVALVFTDLKGSTALYGRLGDAAAYRLVRRHFEVLASAVRAHDGAIVKTIGDAVMAAFAEPADAVAAALEIRAAIAAELGGDPDAIAIRLGIHAGPCIAVSMNDRLDYFGATVNLAARLEGQSRGGDIVISAPLAADPAVAALLAGLNCSAERAPLRGLAGETPFVRIPPRDA